MLRRLLTLCLFVSASTGFAADTDATLAAKVKANFDAIRKETLPNGLRVYMLPIPSSPIVTTMTAYRVGACDEDKSATGLSHYLEHLLFKGTDKLNPGDIDRLTQRKWVGTEDDAWAMVALAVKLCGEQGGYRGPAGATHVFIAFGEVTLSKK